MQRDRDIFSPCMHTGLQWTRQTYSACCRFLASSLSVSIVGVNAFGRFSLPGRRDYDDFVFLWHLSLRAFEGTTRSSTHSSALPSPPSDSAVMCLRLWLGDALAWFGRVPLHLLFLSACSCQDGWLDPSPSWLAEVCHPLGLGARQLWGRP